jgi:hypothetical protein
MSELDLYLDILLACNDCDVDATHEAFWRSETDTAALHMLAERYGVEVYQ